MRKIMSMSTSSTHIPDAAPRPPGMWHGYRFREGVHMKGRTTVLELEGGTRVLCDAVSTDVGHLDAFNFFEYMGYGRDVTHEVLRNDDKRAK